MKKNPLNDALVAFSSFSAQQLPSLTIYIDLLKLLYYKNAFYFILKVFSFSRYLNFCLDFLGMQKKQLDQKDKVNFEIYDVRASLTKNYKTHIAQYLMN